MTASGVLVWVAFDDRRQNLDRERKLTRIQGAIARLARKL
jgi:hypothetical protein